MRIAIQMDAIQSINPNNDSTLLIGAEACKRGHSVFYYTPEHLSFDRGVVKAYAAPIQMRLQEQDYFTLGEFAYMDLSNMDVVLMRNDPPFDTAYITATYILEKLQPKVRVVNDPFHVRNNPEKWLVQSFQDITPATLISRDIRLLTEFRKEQKDIVLKPLYGFGGHSIFRIREDDQNFTSFLEMYFASTKEPIIAQAFVSEVDTQEKRILIIGGEIMPVMNRRPAENEIRSNVRVGGSGHRIELTPKQRAICERLIPHLNERGFFLVGLDMIGDYVTEINVTSPTSMQWTNRAYGIDTGKLFWDALEKTR
jgi:glutathione synthase